MRLLFYLSFLMKEFTRGFLLVVAFAGALLALWPLGQNLYARRSQNELRQNWQKQEKTHRPKPAKSMSLAAKPQPTKAPEFPSTRLVSADAKLDAIVVRGIREADLRRGPGWMPGTALPGQAGNCVIAGHRNVYGSPFMDLDRLSPGSEIEVQTSDETFIYTVVTVRSAADNELSVTAPPADGSSRLTLITCTIPRTTSRIIVSAIKS